MQKSLYDQSTLTWSPQGRLYQVEYAMEAVNQGNLLIGVKSKNLVVLVGFKTAPNEKLSYFPEKLFKVSNHIGIGIAGLTPDGRLLYQYMKNQCLNYNYTFNADYPVEKLVNKIAEKSQLKTQRGENKRPYGVGLLIAGYDRTGPRLFRTCPSANFYEYNCVAIGSRCQGATSFLENNMEKLPDMNKDELIKIALEATKKAEDVKIDGNNLDVIVVGKDETTKLLSIEEIDNYLKGIENRNAHYECAICIAYPNGDYITEIGTVSGIIIDDRRGNGGFGYDPYFYIPEFGKTFAEVPLEKKNTISHRNKALMKIKDRIDENFNIIR